nr:hypothetical protein CFP56_74116 [Quercus suber]
MADAQHRVIFDLAEPQGGKNAGYGRGVLLIIIRIAAMGCLPMVNCKGSIQFLDELEVPNGLPDAINGAFGKGVDILEQSAPCQGRTLEDRRTPPACELRYPLRAGVKLLGKVDRIEK